jgi:translation initiation factor IF-3
MRKMRGFLHSGGDPHFSWPGQSRPRTWVTLGGHISTEPRINERIRVPEVRLVGPAGEQVGIVAINDALRLAQEADLDLVEVAPMARPPVAKLMDYGKFKYESALKARESRKNQAQTVIKEIKLRPKIDPHDYGTKKGHVERFLKAGDKVKVTIMFRGREQSRPELGFKLLQRLAADVEELGFVESTPKQDGRNMIMVIGPHKRKTDAMAAAKAERATRSSARHSEHAEATRAAESQALAEEDSGVAAALAEQAAASPARAPATSRRPAPDEAGAAANEPAKAEPGRAEPARAEPARAEPAKAGPAKAESAKAEPAKAAPAKAEPAKTATDPGRAAAEPAGAAPEASRAAPEAVKAAPATATPRPSAPRPQPRPGGAPGSAAPKPTAPRTAASPAARPGAGAAAGASPRPAAPRSTPAGARASAAGASGTTARPGPARRTADGPVPSPRTVAADKAAKQSAPPESDSES